MLDVLSGGRLVAGFPVGTSMDTNFAYGVTRRAAPRALLRSPRPDHAGVDQQGREPLQRQVQPAALHEPVAAAAPAAAPANLDSRRRLHRDVGVVRRHGLPLLLPLATAATSARKSIMDGFWKRMDDMGKEREPVPRRLRPDVCVGETESRGRRSSTASTSTTSTTAACTSTPASPMPPAIARTARSRPASSRSSKWPPSAPAWTSSWEGSWRTATSSPGARDGHAIS